MGKLKSKSDVIEWYWTDYLDYCIRLRNLDDIVQWKSPTLDGFWLWYITHGPLGLKVKGHYYTKTDVEYL